MQKVKLFKQYLIETNAFQSLVEIFTLVCANLVSYKLYSVYCKPEKNHIKFVLFLSLQLRKCDPKPSDPMQFIRKRLAEPTVDADEFQSMKQSLIKLTDDVSQIQASVSKIMSIILKLLPPANDSTQSMENNVGDESHISILEDSMVFDETVNQTVINSADLDSTMLTSTDQSASDASNVTKSKDDLDGFTMEIVEVDVVQQTQCSQDSLPVSQGSTTTYTSTPNTSMTETQTSDFGQNGLSTGELTGDTTLTSSESESQVKVNIEDLPIVMKVDASDEQTYVIYW